MSSHYRFAALLLPLGLMACTGESGDVVAAQEEACAAAVAAQIGESSENLMATWQRQAPSGEAIVRVDTNEATYECEISAAMQVMDIRGGGAGGSPT